MNSNKNESVRGQEVDIPNVPFTDYERKKLDEAWYTANATKESINDTGL